MTLDHTGKIAIKHADVVFKMKHASIQMEHVYWDVIEDILDTYAIHVSNWKLEINLMIFFICIFRNTAKLDVNIHLLLFIEWMSEISFLNVDQYILRYRRNRVLKTPLYDSFVKYVSFGEDKQKTKYTANAALNHC